MAKRFTKQGAVTELRRRADGIQSSQKFDRNNGWAQLRPRNASTELDSIIERAVAYGRWSALLDVAEDIEGGQIGVGEA